MKNLIQPVLLIFLVSFLTFCNKPGNEKKQDNDSVASNELIIFHAGSLSVPIKDISIEFKKNNPQVTIKSESSGSIECARKITELDKACDIIAVSDYKVIDNMLIPKYVDKNIKFATNEMVIAFNSNAKFSKVINADNWIDILQKKEVQFGRSDPNTDPCGYRTIFTLKLAENFYKKQGIEVKLENKSFNNIRPKEVDLLALLESNSIDYIFIYKSVAIQHNLEYIVLPDEINLKNYKYAEAYSSVFTLIKGKNPNVLDTVYGEPMIYSIAMLKNAPNKLLAEKYLDFFLSETGLSIIEKNGQPRFIE